MAVRIALVGPLAAGKTVMKRQFVHGAEAFAPWHEGEPASDFSSAPSLTAGWFSGSRAVAMGDRRVVLEVWDSPAGLGRFRPSTMAVIATGTLRLGAVVLLFDVTKRAHFEEIRTWLRELEAIGRQGAAVYLVGNKVDLAASRAVHLREMQMLASHPLLSADRVFETSARTGEGVEALFGNLAFPAALAGTWRSAEHPRGPLTWAPDPVAELRDLSTPDGPSARVDLPRLAAAIATAREAGAPAADIARAEAVVEAAARFSGARREAKAQVALGHDGFSLSPVLSGPDGATWTRLSQLLDTDPDHLGTGKDVQKAFGPYDRLRLASAWRIAHPRCRAQYAAGRDRVRDDLDLIRKRGRLPTGTLPGLPTRTSEAAAGFGMDDGANEALLLHGTSPAHLLDVLSNGLNERFSGTSAGAAFGEGPSDGIYLAEDVGKSDQYVAPDTSFDGASELHRRLYGDSHRHQGDVFYTLVCRVALGYPDRTAESGRRAHSLDGGAEVFPTSFRELAPVPGVTPSKHHHCLIAELGGAIRRYREFVVFHGEFVLPEFLIAYQRFSGDERLSTHTAASECAVS